MSSYLNFKDYSGLISKQTTVVINNINYFYNLQIQGSSTLDIMIEIEREKKATIKFYQDFLNDLDNSPLE